jgi:hypothetical protein
METSEPGGKGTCHKESTPERVTFKAHPSGRRFKALGDGGMHAGIQRRQRFHAFHTLSGLEFLAARGCFGFLCFHRNVSFASNFHANCNSLLYPAQLPVASGSPIRTRKFPKAKWLEMREITRWEPHATSWRAKARVEFLTGMLNYSPPRGEQALRPAQTALLIFVIGNCGSIANRLAAFVCHPPVESTLERVCLGGHQVCGPEVDAKFNARGDGFLWFGLISIAAWLIRQRDMRGIGGAGGVRT